MVEQGEVSKVASPASLFAEINDVRGQYQLRETFTLQRICTDLEGHGYAVQPILIPACAVGAPHRRDRVFIVARRIASDTDNGTDGRTAGEDEGKGGAQRVQERHEVRKPEEPNQVRPEGATIPQDSMHSRQIYGQDEVEGSERNEWDIGARGGERICSGTSRADSPHPDSHRGREVDEHMESELADGAKPVSNGRQRNVADTERERLLSSEHIGQSRLGERLSSWCGCRTMREGVVRSEADGICGERWQNFPSVSPVHRGNDGLPFDVDRLTISFGKWRTEALKAYGNAIVPQVMYEIFRAIEQVESKI
jgi:DNA (cytosine-5)-methyltransferase 1